MSNKRSKLLVDIANSKNTAITVCEAHDLINYFDEVVEVEPVPQIRPISKQHESMGVINNQQRKITAAPEAEASFYDERPSTSSNLLTRSDLNFITDEISDTIFCNSELENILCCDKPDDTENVSSTLPTGEENFSNLQVEVNQYKDDFALSETINKTPVPSLYDSFEENENESDLCRESTPVFSDTSVRSSPLASSEYSGSSTPHSRKKKRIYVKKALIKNRTCNKSNWLDVKRKLLVNLGKSHKSRSGKELMGKVMKPSCKTNCRLKCYDKFDTSTREKLFNKFWDLGDHSQQWTFIASNMKKITKKQWTQDSKRLNVFKFFLPRQLTPEKENIERVMVCKTMFKNTLAISNTFIQSAIHKFDTEMGMCSKDMRGYHTNHPKMITPAIKEIVIEHVESFVPVESHYTRKDSNKLYLDSDLNFRKMYDLYLQYCKDFNVKENIATSVRQYKDIINNELNIAFHIPKKDQCDVCHAYKNNDTPSEAEKNTYNTHMNNKKVARKLKTNDKIEAQSDSSRVCTAMFDFQKINNTPHGEISVLYYKRKLSVYNFTVFDAGLKKGTCYMWDESQAKRDANEVASCLFSFVKNRIQDGIKHFRFWSDNCAGQNRNRIVFFMYMYVSKTFKIDICHRFLEKGHTQNEADSVHALIERTAKNKCIYIPDEWFTLVRWAKQNGTPYEVIEIDHDFVLNFKALLNTKYWLKDSDGEKICWNKIRELNFFADQPDVMHFKYDLFEENCRKLNCDFNKKVTRNSRANSEQNIITLQKSYSESIPISDAKFKDLITLCDTMIIPQKYHSFYKNLKHSNVVSDANNVENEED